MFIVNSKNLHSLGTFQPDGLKRVDERVFKSTSQLTPATELFTVINALLIRMPAQSSCRKALLVSSTIIKDETLFQ